MPRKRNTDVEQLCTYLTIAFMEHRSEYVMSKPYPAYDLYNQVLELAEGSAQDLIDHEECLLEYDKVVQFVLELDLKY